MKEAKPRITLRLSRIFAASKPIFPFMLRSLSYPPVLALAAVVLLGGCRTYGGYDTEPKTYQAMQKVVKTFEGELERAKTDLQMLEEAATERDTLHSLAKQFHDHVREHESFLHKQRQRVDRLSADASYRNLHNAYGATLTEQRLIQQKYQRVIRTVFAAVQDTVFRSPSSERDRQYTILPVGFPIQEDGEMITMEQALRGR